ncbi:hypothetical protein [Streptomyces sp. NPDC048428]|uniref:hypothetical protein n=1 Tax=Streptomyces sp. NPDC048428 TaxID=3154503 RepID=UPI0034343AB0
MIQHMNLVFQAGGLKTGEGAFLQACANHTDDRGYVIAHMQQLADEAHMSLRTAQSTRAKLEERGLLKSKDRYSPKNGAQIANLFRINLDKLARMKRPKKDYGSLIEELTFDSPEGPSEENPRSDPHADSAPPPADSAPPPAESAGDGGAESAPLLPPSSVPSSLSGPAGPTGDDSDQDEREAAAPEDNPAGTAGGVPGPRENTDSGEQEAQAVTMLVGLPGKVSEQAAQRLVPLVGAAVAAGWTLERLRAHLARLCDPERVRYAPAVYEKHLRELPAAPASSRTGRAAAPAGMCARHSMFVEGDCPTCRHAENARLARGRSEPGPVDGMGLLARVQAGMAAGGAQ